MNLSLNEIKKLAYEYHKVIMPISQQYDPHLAFAAMIFNVCITSIGNDIDKDKFMKTVNDMFDITLEFYEQGKLKD
jgi:hypothetical protein